MNPRSDALEVLGGRVAVRGRLLPLPNLIVQSEIARGAHGVVYKAYDEQLQRLVAVKFWVRRLTQSGKLRAQREIAKLAQIVHPLFVAIYSFDMLSDVPCAVMEYIPAQSGHEWVKLGPSIQERCMLWSLYSSALRHVYSRGLVHGDPHLGNILVSREGGDFQQHFCPEELRISAPLAIKVVDTGSSLLWLQHDEFVARENRIILETALRIFSDQRLRDILIVAEAEDHVTLLCKLDRFCEFVSAINNGEIDDAVRVGRIAQAVAAGPNFRLTGVLEELKNRRIWGIKHVFRLVGERLGFDDDRLYDSVFGDDVVTAMMHVYLSAPRKATQ